MIREGKKPRPLRRSISLDAATRLGGLNGGDHADANPYNFESKLSPRQQVLLKSAVTGFSATQYGPQGGANNAKFKAAALKIARRKGAALSLQLGADGRLQAPSAAAARGRGLSRSKSLDNGGPQPQPPQIPREPNDGPWSPKLQLLRGKNSLDGDAPDEPSTELDASPASSPRSPKKNPWAHPKLKGRNGLISVKARKENSETLDKKLLQYQTNRDKLDKIAEATGVRRETQSDAAKVIVGERCEVFSPEANSWVRGVVIEVSQKGDRVRVRYPVGSAKNKGKETAARWVNQASSEFRRAGVAESSSDFVREKAAFFQRLTTFEKKKAINSLLRTDPAERTAESVAPLVAWTYCADLFYGLKERQRREICLMAEGEETAEGDALINVGEIGVRAHIVMKGECAIYTMRGQKSAKVEEDIEEDDEDVDLKEKFQSMQRRASIAVRTDAVAAPVVMNNEGQAVLTPAVPASERRRSIAIAMAEVVQAPDAAAQSPTLEPSVAANADMGIPVQLLFKEGDALGVQSTFHNMDTDLVEEEGWRKCRHTVTAQTKLSCMVIKHTKHLQILQRAYENSQREKVALLKTVPNYATHPEECLEEMAKYCSRIWHQAGERIMLEGEDSDSVFYIVSGQCRVVKDLGNAGERALNVLGRGACMGDWGVVNKQPRIASCIAVGEVQVLEIAAFNFEATATQALLNQLSETATEAKSQDETESAVGNVRAKAFAGTRLEQVAEEEEQEEEVQPTFQLITRRDKRDAASRIRAGEVV